jgi:chromosome segregation ATPase
MMQPDLEPMLPPDPRPSNPAPLWVWALVVGLGAISVYSGYTALSARQLYLEGEHVRSDLAQQRDRLKANVADLSRQMEQANRSRDEVENALKQSRANTESSSRQIADLQKQVGELQQKAGDLDRGQADLQTARDTATADAKTAHEAKDAALKEVANLKTQLAAAQKKLNQALADLKREREQVSPVPVGPPAGAPPAGAAPPPPPR